jgi:hypothetical protein
VNQLPNLFMLTTKAMTANLETKVPTLETCIRARDNGYPQGKSYFVWMQVYHRPWEAVPRAATIEHDVECIKAWKEGTFEIVDAPMLQEVLEELPMQEVVKVEEKQILFKHYKKENAWWLFFNDFTKGVAPLSPTTTEHSNPCEAALNLWLLTNNDKPTVNKEFEANKTRIRKLIELER